jgi:hypothetical protein
MRLKVLCNTLLLNGDANESRLLFFLPEESGVGQKHKAAN